MAEDLERSNAAPSRDTAVNTVEPVKTRAKKNGQEQDLADTEGHRPVSLERGDLPATLAKRYFTEEVRGATLLYAGAGAKTPAIRDEGGRLSTTESNNPAIARDMALIALHRGWSTIKVRGEDDFRREVWLEARTLGLEVKGWKPRQRDEQELAARQKTPSEPDRTGKAGSGRADDREPPTTPRERKGQIDRVDFAAGVSAELVGLREEPYQHKKGGAPTPVLTIRLASGAEREIWGAKLPEALAKSGAKVGDQISIKKDGVEHVMKTIKETDPETGRESVNRREVPRNLWNIVAEQFREATPAQAARDPKLKGAQSHLAVVEAVVRRGLADPAARARVMGQTRERVAEHLAEGRTFAPARVRSAERGPDPEQALAQDQGRERVRKR